MNTNPRYSEKPSTRRSPLANLTPSAVAAAAALPLPTPPGPPLHLSSFSLSAQKTPLLRLVSAPPVRRSFQTLSHPPRTAQSSACLRQSASRLRLNLSHSASSLRITHPPRLCLAVTPTVDHFSSSWLPPPSTPRKIKSTVSEYFDKASSNGQLVPKMRIVGLTGGISSGKSTVSNIFKANNIPVVDADIVARDVLKKGTGGWKKVVKEFGDGILQPNGEVDRPKLGQIVFSDPSKRQLLNRLLAPYISSGIFQEVLKLWLKGSKIIVLDVPLLFEAKLDKWTSPVVVVWVDGNTQLQRLKARDGISDEEAVNKINAQMPLDLKRSKADIVIDNNGTLEDLNEQVEKVLRVVTRPLTWREKMRSRQSVLLAIASIVAAILLCNGNSL